MVIKITCKQLTIAVGLLIASFAAKAQMSGTYTVPGSYPTISAAVNALNSQGINGPVTINVNAGHTETVAGTIILNATGTASNTITIQKSGIGANPKLTAMPNGIQLTTSTAGLDGIFALNGSDYVTIDGIDLAENNVNTTALTCMEYGYGLFKASATDGCQYNTIKNSTITLNRNNNNIAGNLMYAGCAGILIINAQIGAANTALVVSSPSGSNSYNKIYSNTIQNANAGIYAIGFGNAAIPFTNADLGNDFGGTSAATGNQILNFGGATLASQPSNGIQIGAQYNFNIAYNTINNNTGAGINHANVLRGIYVNNSGASASGTISNNIITLKNATGSSSTMEIIRTSAITGGTINILNNTLTNCTHSSTGIFYGIWNDGTEANVNIKNNIFTNVVSSVAANTNYLISNTGLVTNALSIDNNSLSFNFTAPTSTATLYWINAGTANLNYGSYSGNTINNYASNNTGTHYMFLINPAYYANATEKINNNALVGGYKRTGTAGTTYGIYHYPSGSTVNDSISGNLLDGYKSINSTGSFYGIYDFGFSTAPYANKYIVNNSISDLRTNGLIYGIYNYYHNQSVVGYNTMLSDTVGGTAYCFYTSSTGTNELDIRNNTLKNFVQLSSTAIVYGLYQLGGNKIRVFNNNFDNITSYNTSNVGGTIFAYYFTNSTNTEIYNNQISNLKALTNLSSVNTLYGMYFSGGTSYKVYHNTIYLANTTTSGTNFGATGLYYANTITGMDLRNNIINVDINPKGTGIVTALRASSGPNNLLASSNANVFYTPNVANSFFYGEGLPTTTFLSNTYSLTNDPNFNNPCGSLFKTFMSPKMQKSFTENNLGLVAGFYAPSGLSFAEGLADGTGITNVTTDITNTIRANPADAGAEEFSGIPNDKSGPSISFTPIADLNCTTATATLTATITDASGVNVAAGTKPRLYFKKSTDANAFLANTTGTNGWKFVESSNNASPFTFTVNAALLNSALATGDVINYFVVAQDNATNPNLGTSASFPSTFCGTTVALPAGAALVTNFNSFNVNAFPSFTATDSPDPVCAGDSITLTALIGGPQTLPTGYCSASNSGGGACIYNVTFNTINNSSVCVPAAPFYIDYSGTVAPTNITAGQTYTFSVSTPATGFYNTSIVSVWIDWNRDGVLAPTEWYQPYTNANTGSIAITAPANLVAGLTKMRVRSRGGGNTNGSGDACTFLGSGETEDYVINLIGSTTSGSSITWYNNATPTIPIGTTNPLKIQANASATYNATVTDPSGCSVNLSTTNTVLPLPTAPTATNSTQCGYGIPTAAVTSTAGANGTGTFNWFNANVGGTNIQTGSNTYLSPITNTTIFYVSELGTNGCNSNKVAVTANVTTPPAFTASSSQVGVCSGGSVTLSATSTANPSYAYTWNPGNLTGSPVTVSPSTTTKYYVVGTTLGGGPFAGCSRLDSLTIQVVNTPPPSGTTTPTAASICIGSGTPISLVYPATPITLFTEDFELNPFGSVSGFGTLNTFAWWRTSTYAFSNAFSTWMQPFNNANLWFTNTASVNLNGTSNPTLTFSHICAMEPNADYGWVEYSTDNGTTWNNFPTSAYVGTGVLKNSTTSFDVSSYPDWIANSSNATIAPTNLLWKNETIKLDAYSASTQFKVRFRISSNNNNVNYYGWVVDNVKITSQYKPVWTPLTGLYKNAALTIPLTAADTLSTVFASPSSTTSYTTQTSNAGCLSVASTPPTVITVNTYPTNPVIAGNSPLCTGNTFTANLTHATVSNPTYSWSGPGPYTATTQNASIPNITLANNGTYKVVINNNGCKDSATVNLVVNQTPKIDSITTTSPTICGTSTATMTLWGLTPNTSFNLSYTKIASPGSPSTSITNTTVTTNALGQYTITNLSSGVYATISLTKTYAVNSCSFVFPTNITILDANPPATPVISANTSVCLNQPINVNCSVSTPLPYQVNWMGPNGFASTNLNNLIANAQFANAGTYSVTVTKNNCISAIATVNVAVNALPPAPFIGSNSPVCTGAILNLNSTNNQVGTTYTWTGPNGFTSTSNSPTINNVSFSNQGTYTAYSYFNGCQSANATSITVTVNQTPNAPVASSNTPVCANGVLQLFASNVPGTTYVWSGPTSYASNIQNPIVTNASVYGSGTYTVNAVLQGCYSAPATTNVVVLPTPPNPTVNNLNICQGSGPQSLSAVGVGLKWYTLPVGGFGNTTAPLINPTVIGTTTYYVTQTINGCESNRQALIVNVLPQPVQPNVANTNINYCQFDVPQALTATGNNILWYTINPTQGGVGSSTAPTVNTFIPGVKTYWVTQSGSNGCPSAPLAITVTVNAKPAPPLVTSPIRYCRDEVAAPVAATGQNLKWYVSATGGIPSILVPTPNTSAPATYTYYVTQTVNGCESDREQVVVNIIDRPNGFIAISPLDTTTKVICPGDQLTMSYFGNAGTSATYTWSVMPGDQLISGSGQGPVVVQFNVTDSNRRVFLTINDNGCSSIMESHIIIVKEVPVLDIIAKADVCLNDLVQINLNNTTHARIDLYNWDFDGANVVYGNYQAGPMGVVWTSSGTKVVQLTGVLDNCVTKPDTMLVTVHDLPIANIQGATGVDICANDTVTLVADDAPNLSYTWTPAGFFYNGNTTATVSANVTFSGYIHLVTKDNWGCMQKDSVYMNAKACCDIFIPNAFSPNNDGKNDIFRIVSQPNQDIHQFRVVNRWGQTVFQTVSMYIGWDGSFNGKAQDPGTYFYYVKYTCSDGTIKEKSGDFMLVR